MEALTAGDAPEMAIETSPDIDGTPRKIQKAREVYRDDQHATLEAPPTTAELAGWYIYGLCSYFVQAFLLPVLFPLIVVQRASPASSPPPPSLSDFTFAGVACSPEIMTMYQRLVNRSITISHSKFSSLHWTAISWSAGIFLAAPLLPYIAGKLDQRGHQPLILAASIMVSTICCLITGLFKTIWVFPIYIAAITTTSTIAAATNTCHLGLILRGLTAVKTNPRAVASSRLSLYATAAGTIGTAAIAAFTCDMLRRTDQLTSMWVVSIFSGLKFFLAIANIITNRSGSTPSRSMSAWYPNAAAGFISVFLSSFSSTCIFTSGTLYAVGGLCIKLINLLYLWIAYFAFPTVFLPVLHPIQLLIRADAVKMNLLGFLLSAVASGIGFYFRDEKWKWVHILAVALVQSAGVGILHAFGRVLILDQSPAGKEGVFSAWFEWVKVSGACAGFAVAAALPSDIGTTFGVSFLAAFAGIVVLIFGICNVSDLGAGNEKDGSEEGSALIELDKGQH